MNKLLLIIPSVLFFIVLVSAAPVCTTILNNPSNRSNVSGIVVLNATVSDSGASLTGAQYFIWGISGQLINTTNVSASGGLQFVSLSYIPPTYDTYSWNVLCLASGSQNTGTQNLTFNYVAPTTYQCDSNSRGLFYSIITVCSTGLLVFIGTLVYNKDKIKKNIFPVFMGIAFAIPMITAISTSIAGLCP